MNFLEFCKWLIVFFINLCNIKFLVCRNPFACGKGFFLRLHENILFLFQIILIEIFISLFVTK